jgi:hypothetical protein
VLCSHLNVSSCKIEGTNLFLALAFSSQESFEGAVPVPIGFDGTSLEMPLKASSRNTTLYVKLRDDPTATASITVP